MSWPVKADNMLDISSYLYHCHMFIIYHIFPLHPSLPVSFLPALSYAASLCLDIKSTLLLWQR